MRCRLLCVLAAMRVGMYVHHLDGSASLGCVSAPKMRLTRCVSGLLGCMLRRCFLCMHSSVHGPLHLGPRLWMPLSPWMLLGFYTSIVSSHGVISVVMGAAFGHNHSPQRVWCVQAGRDCFSCIPLCAAAPKCVLQNSTTTICWQHTRANCKQAHCCRQPL